MNFRPQRIAILAVAVIFAVIGLTLVITALVNGIDIPKLFIGVVFVFAGIGAYISGNSYIDNNK